MTGICCHSVTLYPTVHHSSVLSLNHLLLLKVEYLDSPWKGEESLDPSTKKRWGQPILQPSTNPCNSATVSLVFGTNLENRRVRQRRPCRAIRVTPLVLRDMLRWLTWLATFALPHTSCVHRLRPAPTGCQFESGRSHWVIWTHPFALVQHVWEILRPRCQHQQHLCGINADQTVQPFCIRQATGW